MSRSRGDMSFTTSSADKELALGYVLQAGDMRRAVDLPHPRRPHEDYEFSIRDVQAHVQDRHNILPVHFLDPVERYFSHLAKLLSKPPSGTEGLSGYAVF